MFICRLLNFQTLQDSEPTKKRRKKYEKKTLQSQKREKRIKSKIQHKQNIHYWIRHINSQSPTVMILKNNMKCIR